MDERRQMWSINNIDDEVVLYEKGKKVATIVCNNPLDTAARMLVCLNHCQDINTESLLEPPNCGKCKNEA